MVPVLAGGAPDGSVGPRRDYEQRAAAGPGPSPSSSLHAPRCATKADDPGLSFGGVGARRRIWRGLSDAEKARHGTCVPA